MKFLKVVVAALSAAALMLPSLVLAADPVKIRVGATTGSFSYQYRVAKGAGIFEKYGFDAEVFTFSYGIDTVNSAILGETDTAEAADFAVASRLSAGSNLKIVSHIITYNIDGTQLWTNDPNVKTTADLKGKAIGVQKGTVFEYVWAQFFIKQNLEPEEVEQVYLGSNAELIAAFKAKEIAAFWVPQENVQVVKDIENAHKLGNYELAGFSPQAFVLLDEKFIESHKAKIPDFLRVLDEATTFLKEKPDEAAKIIVEDLKIPFESAREGIKTYS
ncbi:MAG: ABC transporter substrate-binding protein, partial [Deltaproteobacteria bacterium]|nr:ABC transporter substrate-binding protein [Deltaproteobacteria bacterium]